MHMIKIACRKVGMYVADILPFSNMNRVLNIITCNVLNEEYQFRQYQLSSSNAL